MDAHDPLFGLENRIFRRNGRIQLEHLLAIITFLD
ncbi:unnamed protein product [Rhodiola kirilowii]